MNCESPSQTVFVSLPVPFIEAILVVRSLLDDDVAAALGESLAGGRPMDRSVLEQPSPRIPVLDCGKYHAEFLGVGFTTDTLAAVFSRVVDTMAEVAPDALDSLANIRTRGRRLIAWEPNHIHPQSPHLPVLQTGSGWWISKNISQDQLKLALRSTCDVSGLIFGKDIKFTVR